MVLPLVPIVVKLLALAVAKKGAVYMIARQYGFPRLYRRILEANNKTFSDPATRKSVRDIVKYTFRIPGHIGTALQDSQVAKVASEFYRDVGKKIFKK